MDKSFKIENINIKSICHGFLDGDYQGLYHKKILSTLSIVQSLEGHYEISVDGSPFLSTENGGVFIAPKNVVQEIIHNNGASGKMFAHWVFIDAVVNDSFSFDKLFSFPVILDEKYNDQVNELISTIRNESNCFEKTKCALSLLKILHENGWLNKQQPSVKQKIEKFVEQNYSTDIGALDIAKELFCSTPQVYKYTKKYFNLSPSNYINSIRLSKAEKQLIFSEQSITDIAMSVGFYDSCRFSKLFKQSFGQSPLNYRKLFSVNNNKL